MMFGPPGSGKGTQSDYLVENHGFVKIATGDILREEIKRGTELGASIESVLAAGNFPQERIVNELVQQRLQKAVKNGGIVFDGYPRTITQAEFLDRMLVELGAKLDLVIELKADESVLLERVTGRFACIECGANYHQDTKPLKVEGKCNNCGGTEFSRRSDDDAETLKTRLAIYYQQTEPLIDKYRQQDLWVSLNGTESVAEVSDRINQLIVSGGLKRQRKNLLS